MRVTRVSFYKEFLILHVVCKYSVSNALLLSLASENEPE